MRTNKLSHLAQMVFGNVEDLRTSLSSCTSIADVQQALTQARQLREGRTKVQLLERHLRKLQKAKPSTPC